MIETIVVCYVPLASTRIAAIVGFGLAYHMTLVYTNATGESFAVTSGPSIQRTQQTFPLAFEAIVDMATNAQSEFGVLVSDPNNNHAFVKGRMADFYTQDYEGKAYPAVVAYEGRDLSAQWHTIVATYATIARQNLTYSPINQNSNSLAGSALRNAGIPIPFASNGRFAPGVFTRLPHKD